MAYSPCPSCGGRLPESSGQDRPAAPAAGHSPGIPAPVFAACLFLVLVVAAILVQALSLHLVPAPAAANTSASPSPVLLPESTVPADAGISAPGRGTPSTVSDTPGNTTFPPEPASTMLVPSPVPVPTGPMVTGPGTPPARAAVSSPEVRVINATSLAARVHELVNRARQENGRSVLGTDAALASLARAHSADMASKGYFGHVNLDEMDPTARGAAAGYTCHKGSDTYYTYGIAENIFATYRHGSILMVNGREMEYDGKSEEAIAEETVDAWMNSPDHRDNILDPGMGREGIGVAFGQDDMVFVTQDFC